MLQMCGRNIILCKHLPTPKFSSAIEVILQGSNFRISQCKSLKFYFCSRPILLQSIPHQCNLSSQTSFKKNSISCLYSSDSAVFFQLKNFSLSSKYLDSQNNDDDLRAILKDKSLGITAKFKLLFRQYGLVMIVVHLVTSAFWVAIFYSAISRGIDIIPMLESWGVFDKLESWGFSYAEKLKNSGASDYLMTYLLYELAKPIRYPVTLFGTMYAVRYLRKTGFLKPPPQSATVRQLVKTQGKLVQNRMRRTANKYQEQYKSRVLGRRRRNRNGNGKT